MYRTTVALEHETNTCICAFCTRDVWKHYIICDVSNPFNKTTINPYVIIKVIWNVNVRQWICCRNAHFCKKCIAIHSHSSISWMSSRTSRLLWQKANCMRNRLENLTCTRKPSNNGDLARTVTMRGGRKCLPRYVGYTLAESCCLLPLKMTFSGTSSN